MSSVPTSPTAAVASRAPWPTGRDTADQGSPPVEITVCIANWNCCDLLRRCLQSLYDQPQGVRFETVIVDNASTDGAVEMVLREFPEVVLIRNGSNRGFARANNQAAELACGRHLFFLNNDTELPAGSLRELVAFAESCPNAGLIGPALFGVDGQCQVSYRGRPTVFGLLHRTILFRWTGLFRSSYRRYRREGFEARGEPRSVEVLMGAALVVRRDIFEAAGGWDEVYDFGGEDIELSCRIGQTHDIIYYPAVQVLHHGRVSSRQNITFAAPNVAIGYVHCLRRTGTPGWAVLLYKLAITLDLPPHLLAKLAQWGWRSVRGQHERASKSRIAAAGLWRLATRELGRFWRA